MKKTVFKKGFTLIELMIVIVILGVLMGTILPRLTGAQARARDTGRIADLNTVAQALETYFDDNGTYPGTQNVAECLRTGDIGSGDDIKGYLKGNEVPTPAQSQKNGGTADTETPSSGMCIGAYVYIPLSNKGINKNGYVLLTDVETYQKANAILDANTETITGAELVWPTAASPEDDVNTVSAQQNTDANDLKIVDNTNAAYTVYVVYN